VADAAGERPGAWGARAGGAPDDDDKDGLEVAASVDGVEAGDDDHPFRQVRARRAVDELFRNAQQALVAYTGQADMKANIVITTSSVVLTLVATRWSEHSLRPGLTAVSMFTLCALLTAITVVIPKFRHPPKDEVRMDFAESENPLFFGHFASMPRDRWVEIVADIAADDATLYEAQARDIYDQGRYLMEMKYRHLRLAYVFLGLAFVGGIVVQVIAAAL
jgi:hypothetical protein